MKMMKYCYYPGCTLKTKAKHLDSCARASAEKLGASMEEFPEWQCCGAVYPLARDEIMSRLSAVRALKYASGEKKDLLTLCSACHHVIKRVNHDMESDAEIRKKVNSYLSPEAPYSGETRVVHYLEMLRDDIGFTRLREQVVKPLNGLRVAAYYGCLLLRPSAVMKLDDGENPSVLEDFISALGGEAVVLPYRNECCGGYVSTMDSGLSQKVCQTILSSATEKGVEAIITACPLCMYNLGETRGKDSPEIYYFTEMLADALGISTVGEERESNV